jgi:hypothetical protein
MQIRTVIFIFYFLGERQFFLSGWTWILEEKNLFSSKIGAAAAAVTAAVTAVVTAKSGGGSGRRK